MGAASVALDVCCPGELSRHCTGDRICDFSLVACAMKAALCSTRSRSGCSCVPAARRYFAVPSWRLACPTHVKAIADRCMAGSAAHFDYGLGRKGLADLSGSRASKIDAAWEPWVESPSRTSGTRDGRGCGPDHGHSPGCICQHARTVLSFRYSHLNSPRGGCRICPFHFGDALGLSGQSSQLHASKPALTRHPRAGLIRAAQ